MYSETTKDITVHVEPVFLAEKSDPEQNHFVWAYHVRIENNGTETVQLRDRYWRIVDSTGHTEEVRGPGVVGEQPILEPGGSFEYTSGTPLATPSGIMSGNYFVENNKGEYLSITIPAFSLDSPHQDRQLH